MCRSPTAPAAAPRAPARSRCPTCSAWCGRPATRAGSAWRTSRATARARTPSTGCPPRPGPRAERPPPAPTGTLHSRHRSQRGTLMSNNLPKVAWIGLGIMGSPMSENLIKAGYGVTGYTLEQDKLDRLTAAGGTAAGSIAEAVRDADVVVTMVPASPQVEAVAYGPDGVLAHARPGTLLIDMS